MAKISLILNAIAGTASRQDALIALQKSLEAREGTIESHEVRSAEEIESRVQEAMNSRSEVIAVAGGDGTISSIASKLLQHRSSKRLGVIPFGTLNHFARDLAIPTDAEEAIGCLERSKELLIDVGEVNGKYFLNNSSIGMYPQMVKLRETTKAKGIPKWLAGIFSILTVLRRSKYLRVRLEIEGKQIHRTSPLVFIGNNKYVFEGPDMGTRKHLDEGVLSVIIPHSVSRPGLIWLAIKAIFGRARHAKELDYYYADHVAIDPPGSNVLVSLDGEVVRMASPLEYRVRPKALRVIVP